MTCIPLTRAGGRKTRTQHACVCVLFQVHMCVVNRCVRARALQVEAFSLLLSLCHIFVKWTCASTRIGQARRPSAQRQMALRTSKFLFVSVRSVDGGSFEVVRERGEGYRWCERQRCSICLAYSRRPMRSSRACTHLLTKRIWTPQTATSMMPCRMDHHLMRVLVLSAAVIVRGGWRRGDRERQRRPLFASTTSARAAAATHYSCGPSP